MSGLKYSPPTEAQRENNVISHVLCVVCRVCRVCRVCQVCQVCASVCGLCENVIQTSHSRMLRLRLRFVG